MDPRMSWYTVMILFLRSICLEADQDYVLVDFQLSLTGLIE